MEISLFQTQQLRITVWWLHKNIHNKKTWLSLLFYIKGSLIWTTSRFETFGSSLLACPKKKTTNLDTFLINTLQNSDGERQRNFSPQCGQSWCTCLKYLQRDENTVTAGGRSICGAESHWTDTQQLNVKNETFIQFLQENEWVSRTERDMKQMIQNTSNTERKADKLRSHRRKRWEKPRCGETRSCFVSHTSSLWDGWDQLGSTGTNGLPSSLVQA